MQRDGDGTVLQGATSPATCAPSRICGMTINANRGEWRNGGKPTFHGCGLSATVSRGTHVHGTVPCPSDLADHTDRRSDVSAALRYLAPNPSRAPRPEAPRRPRSYRLGAPRRPSSFPKAVVCPSAAAYPGCDCTCTREASRRIRCAVRLHLRPSWAAPGFRPPGTVLRRSSGTGQATSRQHPACGPLPHNASGPTHGFLILDPRFESGRRLYFEVHADRWEPIAPSPSSRSMR